MKLQQIEYALEIYEKGSYTEAARGLYVSQPRLSQAIRDLEAELGFEIFERSRRGISGTTVRGFQFLEQAKLAREQFRSLDRFRESSTAAFRLSSTLITQAQDAFIALSKENIKNPALDLDLWFSGCYESADRVRTALSDIGVVTIIDTQMADWLAYFQISKLTYHELKSCRFHITVSRYSEFAGRDSLSIEDLSGYTYISEKCSRMNTLTLEVYAILDRICPEARIIVSNTDIMYRLIQQTPDHRIFVLDSVPPAAHTLEQYDLISIPVAEPLITHLGYLTRTGESQSPLAERYIELLEEALLC